MQVVGQQEEHVQTHSTWSVGILDLGGLVSSYGFHVTSPDFENYKPLSGAMNLVGLTNILSENKHADIETKAVWNDKRSSFQHSFASSS